jgi:hypothetical protein
MIHWGINAECIAMFRSDPAVNPCAEANTDRIRGSVLRSPEKWK